MVDGQSADVYWLGQLTGDCAYPRRHGINTVSRLACQIWYACTSPHQVFLIEEMKLNMLDIGTVHDVEGLLTWILHPFSS